VGLEKRPFAFFLALAGRIEERAEKGIDFVRVTVICMEANEDVVFFSESVDRLGEDNGTECGVVDGGSGSELPAPGGDLNDAIGFGLGECLERTICGGEGGDVDGWVCVTSLLGGIEHLTVLFWCRDGHDWRWVTEISDLGKDWLYIGKICHVNISRGNFLGDNFAEWLPQSEKEHDRSTEPIFQKDEQLCMGGGLWSETISLPC